MSYEWIQNVSTIIGFSSEYGTGTAAWSASKILGPPNVYPSCGDIAEAWASTSPDASREYLVLGYSFPAHANRVSIYQTYNPGAVDTVYLRNAATGTWNKIYEATAAASPCPQTSVLEINFTETTYNVDAVRIAINSPIVPSWNEIDAVTLQTNLPPGAKFTQQSGNWSNPSTWAAGSVPTSSDTVVIGNSHNVTLDANESIKSLFINSGGTLTAAASNTLTLGPAGGGKEFLQSQGTIALSNGTIAINGHLDFTSGSTLNMTGGNIIVDGNDGTDPGSVPGGIDLIRLQTSMASCTFAGGTITIVDPQFHTSGQAITGNYTFGLGSTVRIGDGSSVTAGGNSEGFGGNLAFPVFGQFYLDAVNTSGNRHFRNNNYVTVAGNTTINSGKLEPYYDFNTNGNAVNNGTIVLSGPMKVLNDLTNNGNISGTGGRMSVVHDFINNASAVYNVPSTYTSVGNNLVNYGSFTSSWLYFANDFSTSVNAQTIGGPGTYNVYGIEVVNSNPNGLTLLVPMHLQYLYWGQGKFFLGNFDLTLDQYAYGSPGAGNYVVTNGTGKLIINNVSSSPILFSIGTDASYTPFSIVNGSGHNFSGTVKSSFTNPPGNTSVVKREWNLMDLTGGAVNADVTFQWNGSDEDPTFNRSICNVGHYSGGAWHPLSGPGAAAGSDPYTRSATGVTSFSPFAVGSNGALPVKLKSITAVKKGDKVDVRWMTTDEVNMLQYELEKSKDASRFVKLGTIGARGLVTDQQYDMIDDYPFKGSNFYRLKEVNRDATFVYSKTIKIDMTRSFTIFVYPNPARKQIHVQGAEYLRTIQLLDVSGRIIKEWKQPFKESLDLGSTLPGIYQLRMVSAKETLTERLIIAD